MATALSARHLAQGDVNGRSFWWARREPERHMPMEVCAKDGSKGKGPFDVYCEREGHLVFFSWSPLIQNILVYGLRVIVGGLALLGASFKTSIPLYIVAALVGFSVLVLPMRLFRTSRLIAATLWALAFAVAAAYYENAVGDQFIRVIVAATLFTVALGAAGTVALQSIGGDATDGDTGSPANRLVLRSIASGIVLSLGLLIVDGIGLVAAIGFPDEMRIALVAIGVTLLTGAITLAAASGFLRAVRLMSMDVDNLIDPLEPFVFSGVTPPLGLKRPPFRKIDIAARIAFAFRYFLVELAQRVVHVRNRVVKAIAWSFYGARRTAVALVNVSHRVLKLVARALTMAVALALRTLRAALGSALRPLARYGRFTASAVIVGLAASLAVYGAHEFFIFLVHGSLWKGVLGLLLGMVVPLILTASWATVTGRAASEVAEAAGRVFVEATPTALITLLALAWVDGILGLLGLGPITPGWLTGAGSILVIGAIVFDRFGERSRSTGQLADGASGA